MLLRSQYVNIIMLSNDDHCVCLSTDISSYFMLLMQYTVPDCKCLVLLQFKRLNCIKLLNGRGKYTFYIQHKVRTGLDKFIYLFF